MNLTEKEAGEKWCPQMNYTVNAPPMCLGSRCMVWRWVEDVHARGFHICKDMTATTEPPRPAGLPADWTFSPYDESDCDPPGWLESEASAAARRRGRCGLVAL
ncbi:MAG: hypothetical protein U1F35_05235 [Steroidobacteraceae bacterium]